MTKRNPASGTAIRMPPHTPGPWMREPNQRFRHDGSAGVKGPDGMYVATALDFNRSDRDAEVEANARLIAAAPTMAEALEWIWEHLHPRSLGRAATDAELLAITHATFALRSAGVICTPELQEPES